MCGCRSALPSCSAARALSRFCTVRGLMRLRGVEAGSGTRLAEAFHVRKLMLGL